MRCRKGAVGYQSPWWRFAYIYPAVRNLWLMDFIHGRYRFSPMQRLHFFRDTITVWSYPDRLILFLLLKIIKPTFKYIISPCCLHLGGPSQVKPALSQIKRAVEQQCFSYVIRTDIRSYYASIQHDILTKQVQEHFNDPRVLHYLEDIITIGVDDGGNILLPKQGIPIRSSLSPFFGALYLSALDKAFIGLKGVFYLRYMDDIIILTTTKSQYQRAKKRLFAVLASLKLKVAPHKTKMGRLTTFHFLGVHFEVSQNPQIKTQVTTTEIHSRSCRRALDKVNVLKTDAVNPAAIQRYLVRWATWWQRAAKLGYTDLLNHWIKHAAANEPALVWYGTGLLN